MTTQAQAANTEVKRTNLLSWFIKGTTKVGRSYFAASLSRIMPVDFIDVGGGMKAAKEVFDTTTSAIETVDFKSYKQFLEMPKETFFDPLGAAITRAIKSPRKAIVIDKFSEIASRMSDEYVNREKTSFEEWKKVVGRVRRLADTLLKSGKHIVVTSDIKAAERVDSGTYFEALLPGSSATEVPGMFDTVALIDLVETGAGFQWVLRTKASSIHKVGDRNKDILKDVELIPENHPEIVWQKYISGINAK